MELTALAGYKEKILSAGIEDVDCHSEFVGGNHGIKLHYDRIKQGTPEYDAWVALQAETIDQIYPNRYGIRVILSIADGTNQHTLDVADYLGCSTIGLLTEKAGLKKVRLTQLARRAILAIEPSSLIFNEDASTHGTVIASVVPEVRSLLCSGTIAAVTNWQREDKLPRLDELGVPYGAAINYRLVSYKPVDCQQFGLCAKGLPLIPYGK